MYYRFFGQRNPEKDIERILVDLKGSDEAGRFATYFVPVMRGWNDDTAAYVDLSQAAQGGIVMNDTEDIYGWGSFMTPAGWTGIITVTGLFRTVAGTGDCYMRNFIKYTDGFSPTGYGAETGSLTTVTGAGIGAYKVTPGISDTISEQSLVRVYTYRFGSHANDTYDTTIYFLGWEITYA